MDMDRAGASTKTKTGDTNAVVLTKVSLTPQKLSFQIIEKKPSTPERAHTPKPKRAPWEDPIFVAQHAPAEEVEPLGVSPLDEDPLEPIQDVASGDMAEAFFGDFIDYSVSLKGSEDPILPASSDPPPLQLTPRKPPVCIDLTLDPTPVKDCHNSAKDRGVSKDAGMLPSKVPHPVESFIAVPVALHATGRQDGHGTSIGVPKPSADVAMDVVISQDPSVLPIPSHNEERREQLAALNISPTPIRTNDAESSSAEPRDMRPSPSVPVRRRQSVVSFASPLVTRPNSDDAVQIPTMTYLKSSIRSNNHGAFRNGISGTNTRPPKGPILDRVVSLVSDDEFESSSPVRKPSSNRVRFENDGLQYSLSPLALKTSAHPVKQMPG